MPDQMLRSGLINSRQKLCLPSCIHFSSQLLTSYFVSLVSARHDKRLFTLGGFGVKFETGRKEVTRLGNRWRPEVSHTLDFSIMEINKTALNKNRTCKFKRGEIRKVWQECGREKRRYVALGEVGSAERVKVIDARESGYCIWINPAAADRVQVVIKDECCMFSQSHCKLHTSNYFGFLLWNSAWN